MTTDIERELCQICAEKDRLIVIPDAGRGSSAEGGTTPPVQASCLGTSRGTADEDPHIWKVRGCL